MYNYTLVKHPMNGIVAHFLRMRNRDVFGQVGCSLYFKLILFLLLLHKPTRAHNMTCHITYIINTKWNIIFISIYLSFFFLLLPLPFSLFMHLGLVLFASHKQDFSEGGFPYFFVVPLLSFPIGLTKASIEI